MAATINSFVTRLRTRGATVGVHVEPWSGSRTPNILAVTGLGGRVLLYTKARGSGKGFWGLNPNQLEALRRSGQKWHVLLLRMDDELGYMLESSAVATGTELYWKPGHDSEYKVNEDGNLESLATIHYFESLEDSVLSLVRGAS
jgi:hypothetical protein